MENNNDVHTIMATFNWNVLKNLSFNAGVAYSIADMEVEDVDFPNESWTYDQERDFIDRDMRGNSEAAVKWAGEYNPANMNDMESYSDLEYSILNINIGVNYAISSRIGLTLNYTFEDVDDDEAYVYGDTDGTMQSLMGYMTFRF